MKLSLGLLLLPLLCTMLVSAEEPAAIADRTAPAVAVPDLPVYRALPELVTQCGVPHAILIYGAFPPGIMAEPKRWLSGFSHASASVRVILDAWCKAHHFAWQQDSTATTIIVHPDDAGPMVPWRAFIDLPITANTANQDLGDAIDPHLLEKACGFPVQIEIDAADRMMRSGFAYATRAAPGGKQRHPRALSGTLSASLVADAVTAPALHWQIWSTGTQAQADATVCALPVVTRSDRHALPISLILANLLPSNHDLAGYPHELTRIDDAALELYRRLQVDRTATMAEVDHKDLLHTLAALTGEEGSEGQEIIKKLISFGDVPLNQAALAALKPLPTETRRALIQDAIPWPLGTGMTSDQTLITLWRAFAEDQDAEVRELAENVLKNYKR